MERVMWYEVELDSLRLKPAKLAGWPEAMASSHRRMREECLESVVALNLDVLFPGEDLLLIGVRATGWRSADVSALDPLGVLRLIELKKEPTSLKELNEQVISYGLARDDSPPWDHLLARALPDLPERIELSLEAFRLNERAQVLGASTVAAHTAAASAIPWQSRDRFDRAHLVVEALRAARGAPAGPVAMENPRVQEIVTRLYRAAFTGRALADPGSLAAAICEARWGHMPTVSGTEFVAVAPSLARMVTEDLALEQRGACFYLIEAEQRCTMEGDRVGRAVLRWQPLRRTVSTSDLQTALALRARLLERHPAAARLWWDPRGAMPRLYWGATRQAFLRVESGKDGRPLLVTRSDALTQGLAGLKASRGRALRRLHKTLSGQGVARRGDELTAAWDPENLQPAVELTAAYFDLLEGLGFFSVDEYEWYRRPPGA